MTRASVSTHIICKTIGENQVKFATSRFHVLTGTLKTILLTIITVVKMESIVLCATDGRNYITILRCIEPINARKMLVKRDNVQIITLKMKKESLNQMSISNISGSCPETESWKECSKKMIGKLVLSQILVSKVQGKRDKDMFIRCLTRLPHLRKRKPRRLSWKPRPR